MRILPFISVHTLSGKEYTLKDICGFSYKYSEEEDDVAEVSVESNNPYIADHPDFQEGNVLNIVWGYVDSVRSEKVSRLVYIFDTKTEYTSEGIKLTLTCHEKFAASKMDTAKPKTDNHNPSSIRIHTQVLDNIKVKEDYIKNLTGILYSTKNVKSEDIKVIQDSLNKPDYIINYGRELGNGIINSRVVRDNSGLTFTIYSGELPTFRGLRDFFNKLPGGPYVLDSRDDTLIIRPRDFAQTPIHTYAYMADPGELIEFTPETKNRSKSQSSEDIGATGWDSENKTPIEARSKNEDQGQTQKNLWQKLQQEMPTPGSAEWLKGLGKGNVAQPGKNKPRITYKDQDYNRSMYKWIPDPSLTGPGRPIVDPEIAARVEAEKRAKLVSEILGPEPEEGTGPSKTLLLGAEKEENVQAAADNHREESQLENNPATARVVGNPNLKSGLIINIQGVSIRHQGQYYIKECTHTIDDSGYMVSIDKMVRPGIKENKKKAPVQGTQAPVKSLNAQDPAKISSPLDQFNKFHDPTFGIGIKQNPEYNPNKDIDNKLERLGIFSPDET